jgi:hypothetical protein
MTVDEPDSWLTSTPSNPVAMTSTFVVGSPWEGTSPGGVTTCGPITTNNVTNGHTSCASPYTALVSLVSTTSFVLASTGPSVNWAAGATCPGNFLRCNMTTMPSSLVDDNQDYNLGSYLEQEDEDF